MSNNFEKYMVDIPDFPKKGIIFRDITAMLENGEAFRECIDVMVKLVQGMEQKIGSRIDKIICADARGFIFGSAVAVEYGCGLVLARKPGKLPRPGFVEKYSLEYGENQLVVSENSISEGENVVIIDDIIATGGSAAAMERLVLDQKGNPIGAIFLSELVALEGWTKLKCPCYTLISYGCKEGDWLLVDGSYVEAKEDMIATVKEVKDNGVIVHFGENAVKEVPFSAVKGRVKNGQICDFHI